MDANYRELNSKIGNLEEKLNNEYRGLKDELITKITDVEKVLVSLSENVKSLTELTKKHREEGSPKAQENSYKIDSLEEKFKFAIHEIEEVKENYKESKQKSERDKKEMQKEISFLKDERKKIKNYWTIIVFIVGIMTFILSELGVFSVLGSIFD